MIYSVIDVETTGGSPKSSKITEIAIYRHDGKKIIDEFISLVNPEIPIPEFVSNLTGITDAMVKDAPKFYEIAKRIVEITEGSIFVAHNVGFDYGMLRREFKNLGYDYRLPHLCTVITSRTLLPGQDSYSLGKLTRSLGIELIGRHRAGGDALATSKLLDLLLQKSNADLSKFITTEINPSFLHPALDLDQVEELPNKTGIYQFFNEQGELIYVGKAKYVRTAILQHLRNTTVKKSAQWCSDIASIKLVLTGNEFVATVLELTILQHSKPKYNKSRKKTEEVLQLNLESNDRFYFIEKGRNKQEKCLVLIENGQLVGYGYVPFHFNKQAPIFWKRYITEVTSKELFHETVRHYFKKHAIEKIHF